MPKKVAHYQHIGRIIDWLKVTFQNGSGRQRSGNRNIQKNRKT